MKKLNNKNLPIVWSIAGSDSGGGAGIQADLKTMNILGVHGCSIITASTAQNTVSVTDIHNIPLNHISSQYKALKKDLPAKAIKIGMLAKGNIIKKIFDLLSNIPNIPIILDPVMISSSGSLLLDFNSIEMIKKLLFPIAELITPNLFETEILCNRKIKSIIDVEKSAEQILENGAKSVIIKCGNNNKFWASDFFLDKSKKYWFNIPKIQNIQTHGLGCAFSAAIASARALDFDLKSSVVLAKMFITQGIRLSKKISLYGYTPINNVSYPKFEQDIPLVSNIPISKIPQSFSRYKNTNNNIELYPIVSSLQELKMLSETGCTIFQLRIKEIKSQKKLEEEIFNAIKFAKFKKIKLFINDYWKLAIEMQAYGIHLGQDDITTADLNLIKNKNIKLGLSTHNFFEIAIAHYIKPSYISIGPIFPTKTKVMPYKEQGIERLKYWKSVLDYPIIAIGGINKKNIHLVKETKISGISIISGILNAKDPILETKKIQKLIS